jgi:hypothetical protein
MSSLNKARPHENRGFAKQVAVSKEMSDYRCYGNPLDRLIDQLGAFLQT